MGKTISYTGAARPASREAGLMSPNTVWTLIKHYNEINKGNIAGVYDLSAYGIKANSETLTGVWTFSNGLIAENVTQTGTAPAGVGDFGSQYLSGLLDVEGSGWLNGKVLVYNSTTTKWEAQTYSSGVTDHGALTGLSDDDHPQYINYTRGDIRYLGLAGGTLTGTLTGTYFKVNDIFPATGQQMVISAGESFNYRTGQTNEYIYLNAENGLEINSSPDNWSSGWAGRKTTYINNGAGDSSFARHISLVGDVNMNGGMITRNASNVGFLEGSYTNVGNNNTHSNPIYTIGSAYNPALTTLSNMYGIGYSNTSATFITGNLDDTAGWGAYIAADGDARIFLNASAGVVAATGSMKAPTFYGALSGNAATATWADTADVNTSTSTLYYSIMWHSADTLYSSNSKLRIQPSTGAVIGSNTITATNFIQS